MHLGKHPERSWSVILQQAWSMKLRDRLYTRNEIAGSSTPSMHDKNKRGKINKPCKRFNQGNCNFGPNYKHEHHCAYEPCGKFGHTILNCRKLQADKEHRGQGKSHGQSHSQPSKSGEDNRQK